MNRTAKIIEQLKGGLVVSCQARPNNPLRKPGIMAACALAAERGGAVGIRANGPQDIRAIRRLVQVPIIGINKQYDPHRPVYITPNVSAAEAVVRAGADLVAVDATLRPRRGGLSPAELIERIHQELGCTIMADIDSEESALAAAAAGADLIATTLAGYTPARPAGDGPDLELVSILAARLNVPVICEGRIRGPEDVAAAFAAGAYTVVVGTMITNPMEITRRFAAAAPR